MRRSMRSSSSMSSRRRLVSQLFAEGLEVLQVLLLQLVRIDQELVAGHLEVAKLRPFLERELDLLRGEDVEEEHLVALVAKVAQGAGQGADLVEAIGEDN